MDDTFYSFWFSGMERALKAMKPEDRSLCFAECGRACSDSYTRGAYADEHALSESIDDFASRIARRFAGMTIERIPSEPTSDGRECLGNFIIEYAECGCDLFRDGLVHDPVFCECSQESLRQNWKHVFGTGCVSVEMKGSIQNGDRSCTFVVSVFAGPH